MAPSAFWAMGGVIAHMFYCGAACVDVLVLLVSHYQRPTEAPRRPIERSLERSGVLLPDGPLGGLVWCHWLDGVIGTDGA